MSDLSQAAVAVKQNPTMADLIEKQKPEIERQLGGAMSSEAFVRAVLTEVRKSPKLAAADPSTVLGGVMLAAQLRLEIGSGLGEFYLTPRKEKGRDICLPIIGYQGMIKLALRSEMVTSIETFMVREGDRFEYGANAERGMFFEWQPRDFEESRPWTGVVAVARMKQGGTAWIYLTKESVYGRRPHYWNKGTPWQTHEEEMAQKTAIRALSKRLPKSTDLGRAIEADEQKVTHVRGLDDLSVQPVDDVQDAEVVEERGERNDLA